jgi:hypothetical protein
MGVGDMSKNRLAPAIALLSLILFLLVYETWRFTEDRIGMLIGILIGVALFIWLYWHLFARHVSLDAEWKMHAPLLIILLITTFLKWQNFFHRVAVYIETIFIFVWIGIVVLAERRKFEG